MEYMKPCPFCGDAPYLESNHRAFVMGIPSRVALVRCRLCGARTDKFDIKQYGRTNACAAAIEAWNKRVGEGG